VLETANAQKADKTPKQYDAYSVAGVEKRSDQLGSSSDPTRVSSVIASASRFGRRSNPFALNKSEFAFDQEQATEKAFADSGNFGNEFEISVPKEPEPVVEEPQPYRRLSGVVVGDAVYGILEENGTSKIIWPGARLEGTDWMVVSISEEGAVLKRSGNRRPRELTIRLETSPFGGGSSGGGGAPAGGGGAAAGGGLGAPKGGNSGGGGGQAGGLGID
jgi:hypothetical protein